MLEPTELLAIGGVPTGLLLKDILKAECTGKSNSAKRILANKDNPLARISINQKAENSEEYRENEENGFNYLMELIRDDQPLKIRESLAWTHPEIIYDMLTKMDQTAHTPLTLTAEAGYANVLKELLCRILLEDKIALLNQTRYEGDSILMVAILNDHPEAVREILGSVPNEASKIDLLTQKDDLEDTPLMSASVLGNTEIIKALLRGLSMQNKLDLLRQENKEGDTPLILASDNGYTEVIKELLRGFSMQHKLDLLRQENNGGNTPLMIASRKGYTEVIKALLEGIPKEEKFELLRQRNNDGDTPLMIASREGDAEVINALLEGISTQNKLECATHEE